MQDQQLKVKKSFKNQAKILINNSEVIRIDQPIVEEEVKYKITSPNVGYVSLVKVVPDSNGSSSVFDGESWGEREQDDL